MSTCSFFLAQPDLVLILEKNAIVKQKENRGYGLSSNSSIQ